MRHQHVDENLRCRRGRAPAQPGNAEPAANAQIDIGQRAQFAFAQFVQHHECVHHRHGPSAEGKEFRINLAFSDLRENYVLRIENAVLQYRKAPAAADANATLTLTKPIFLKMMAGTAGIKDTLLSDELKVAGSRIDLVRFFTLFDKAPGTFAIATPK